MHGVYLELLKLLYIVAICLGVWTSAHLFLSRTGNRAANRLLMTFVLAVILLPVNAYSHLAFGHMDFCWILTTNLTWLYGPFLLGFIQAVLGRPPTIRQMFIHAVPFTLALFWRLSPWEAAPFSLIIPLFSHIFIYLGICLRLVFKERNELKEMALSHKTAHFYWLLYLIVGLMALMLVDVVLISMAAWSTPLHVDAWRMVVALFALYLQGIACFSLWTPKVFFSDFITSGQQVASKTTDRDPANCELSDPLREELHQRLLLLMKDERPYLRNDLSLAQLAEMLGINQHQLSELLNDHMKCSFYEFVNRHRIEQALQLMDNIGITGGQKMPVLELAFEAGFNNKNTFYRLFKERTGMTPVAYRKSRPQALQAEAS